MNDLFKVRVTGGGGSSAMPHKQNPILAESLTTLARFNAIQMGGLLQAGLHENERSGAAWTLEWMALPSMLASLSARLRATIGVLPCFWGGV